MVAELQGGRYRFEISWSLGDQEEPELEMVPSGVCFSRQVGRDLGERLLRALREAARSASWVVAVGSDHPRLRQTRVEEAIARLRQGHDVVLGPAIDGGYYLIALRANAVERRLFSGIAWSTAAVLDQTLERCREVGLEVALLAPESDVDTPADLERLIQELRASPQDCPRTRLLLERWGRLNGSETR
jgi:rSAM/selenodomain-associated transferase 1